METNYPSAGPGNTGDPADYDNYVNLGKIERMVSLGIGAGLIYSALRSNGFLKYAAILSIGSYLVYRGASGNCPLSACIRDGKGCKCRWCCSENTPGAETKP